MTDRRTFGTTTLCAIAVASLAACNGVSSGGPDPTAPLGQAKQSLARSQIASMGTALGAYHAANGDYPSALSGAMDNPGPDPWGTAWIYAMPGKGGKPYDLYSAGPDKTPNTADDVR